MKSSRHQLEELLDEGLHEFDVITAALELWSNKEKRVAMLKQMNALRQDWISNQVLLQKIASTRGDRVTEEFSASVLPQCSAALQEIKQDVDMLRKYMKSSH